MSDVQNAPAPGGEEAVPSHVAGGSGALSVRDAARSLTDWQNKLASSTSPAAIEKATSQQSPPISQPAAPAEAPAADQSADEADATSPGTEPNGETETADLSESSPIDPPPSWTSEQRERWSNLDRATQEYLVEYDKKTSSAVSRAQKEAAEQLKGLTAREQAMEQARLQFEQATQASLERDLQQLQGEFGDIKSNEDITRLADQDWARYLRWDAHQKVIASKMQVANQANERRAQDQRAAFERYAQEQDKKFIENAPDFADKEKAAELQRDAIKTLRNVGFSEEDLQAHWNGQNWLSLRDAKTQTLIQKAALWDRAQEAKKAVVSNKTLPAVQRPGVAQPKPSREADLRGIENQLANATGLRAIRLAQQHADLLREMNSSRR